MWPPLPGVGGGARLQVHAGLLAQRVAVVTLALVGEAAVARDREQPGGEAAPGRIVAAVAQHGEEDVLKQVIGGGKRADDAADVAVQALLVAGVQAVERGHVAATEGDHQVLVAALSVEHPSPPGMPEAGRSFAGR